MARAFVAEVNDAIGAISSRLRTEFGAGEPSLGFVALATMRHLVRWGPRTVSDLAASEQVTTQAISIRVAPLVESGLISRRADPEDARRTLLDVTPTGRKVVQRANRRANTALRTALESLDTAERRQLEEALPALRGLAVALRDPHSLAPVDKRAGRDR